MHTYYASILCACIHVPLVPCEQPALFICLGGKLPSATMPRHAVSLTFYYSV
jgi:hypothetical protein